MCRNWGFKYGQVRKKTRTTPVKPNEGTAVLRSDELPTGTPRVVKDRQVVYRKLLRRPPSKGPATDIARSKRRNSGHD